MTVVHIAYRYGLNNTGGAMIAATRLHQALLARGVDSHFVCIWQDEEGVNVHQLPTGWFSRRLFFLLTKITRCVWKFSSHRRSIPLNIIPLFGLERVLKQIQPDVVHVHWINADVCSFEQLSRLKCRLVFNLHDLCMINAIAPHPFSDNRYLTGFNKDNSSFIERWIFNRKKRLIQERVSAFVGPSNWVASMCRQSIIGFKTPVYSIPNVVDAKFFQVSNCSSRVSRPSNDKFVLLFGAYGGRRNPFKGFDDLRKSLMLLPSEVKNRCELRIFGEEGDDCVTEGVVTRFLGNLNSADELMDVYHEADIFVFPSTVETQGMTKVEALLCGLPVIAFNRAACAEGLVNGVNGYVVPDGDHAAFSSAVVYFYNKWKDYHLDVLRPAIAEAAARTFSPDAICTAVLRVYGEAV